MGKTGKMKKTEKMGKNKAKALVLASIFTNCFVPNQEMTVNQLLNADKMLRDFYDHRPHVLSNHLRRYTVQGLLSRDQDYRRGHPYYYRMTEKGFKRLLWMINNRKYYFFQGSWDLLKQLLEQIISFTERRKRAKEEARRRHFIVFDPSKRYTIISIDD